MRSTETDFSAAILAGGKNRRLGGRNKALLEVGGRTIVGSAFELLSGIFGEVVIVSNEPKDYAALDAKVVGDLIPGKGPLGGIHSALHHASGDAVFIVACDMPFLDGGLIRRELEAFRAAEPGILVPRVGKLIEPLHSVYSRRLAEPLAGYLREGRDLSIRRFVDGTNVVYWDVDADFARKAFVNINDAEDVKRLGGMAGGKEQND